MSTVANTIKKAQKKYGKTIGGIGMNLPDMPRLPLDILPFDVASGGGIPLNSLTIVYGPESSGKTNFALRAIASYQKRYPDKTCVFIDVEGTTTTEWMAKLGVNTKLVAPIRPTHGEAVVDLVNELLYADDCGLIVIDSIAAIVTLPELEKESEDRTPGMSGMIVSKLVRKCTAALLDSKREGRVPTLIWVNQPRTKIGMTFGNPETMPGGAGQQFMAAMRVRLSGKNIVDSKVSKAMPVVKRSTGVIQKWKTTICTTHFKYDMAMIEHKGLAIGECLDWEVMKKYLGAFKLVVKEGNKLIYIPTGEVFENQAGLWEGLRPHRDDIRELVVKELKKKPTQVGDLEEDD